MTVHEQILLDIKAILETVSSLGKVSYGKHTPLDQESTFAAAYIIPGADTFSNERLHPGVSGYDNSLFIRVIINEDNTDNELKWCTSRDEIIQSILKDNALWSSAVDRDVVSVVYDDMNSFPLMTYEVIFEFTLRETCA